MEIITILKRYFLNKFHYNEIYCEYCLDAYIYNSTYKTCPLCYKQEHEQ